MDWGSLFSGSLSSLYGNDDSYSNPATDQSPGASTYLDLFRRMREPTEPSSFYYDTESPDVKDYLAKASEAPPSESLLSSYINDRPTLENNKPGFGRTLLAALTGVAGYLGDTGKGVEYGRDVLEGPYRDKLADWKGRGESITTRARLADSAKTRELGSLKFNLENKTKAARAKVLADEKAKSLAEIGAKGATGFVNKDEDQARAKAADEERVRVNNERLNNSSERLNLAREKLEFEKSKPAKGKAPKDVTDFAREAKANATLLERAKDDAVNHPAFKQYFTLDPATDRYTFTGPPEIKTLIDKFVKARLTNYSKGLQPDLEEGF